LRQLKALKDGSIVALKSASNKPDFKYNPSTADGEPSKAEMAYGQGLMDLLSDAYDDVEKTLTSEASDKDKVADIDERIDKYITDSQELANKSLTDMFTANMKVANGKLADLKIKAVKAPKTIPLLDNLIDYQNHAIMKAGSILKLELEDVVYKLSYFNMAYPNSKG